MPALSWQGIANSQSDTNKFRVWLSRPPNASKDTPWQPLRHVDCQKLRETMHNPRLVHIEGGRATADPVANVIFENFVRSTQRTLCHAAWFIVDEETKKSKKETLLWPITEQADEDKIETLYQNAIILINEGTVTDIQDASPPVTLSTKATVRVVVQGKEIFLRQSAPGWFGHTQVLQRGYGPYIVSGEQEELALGPVRSLAIVVHGIGEKYFTSGSQTAFPSLLDQTHTMRIALQKQQLQAHERDCEAAKKAGKPLPGPPGRIELLPIEWFEALHNEQSEVMKSLQAVTLPSIPALRTIANDIVFDVLVYLTPNFCQAVLEKVHQQITTLYQAFQKVHTDFNGPVALIGHSLGSVIVWDLLTLRRDYEIEQQQQQKQSASSSSSGWGPSVPDRTKLMQPLPFDVDTCIFLGSPIGMFLSLRGARDAFDKLRQTETNKISPFTLPARRVLNIFNTSDPVAYRIEPLLVAPSVETTHTATSASSSSTKATEIPAPAYLTAPGKDVRLHVKARQLGDGIRKSLLEPTSAWTAVLGAVAAAAVDVDAINSRSATEGEQIRPTWKFPLGGASDRVDFALQPNLVDNEYISAVLAHSTTGYLLNTDFLEYVVHHLGPGKS